jgi:hypothetical protein
MNWLKNLFFAETWGEFAQNLLISAALLAGLWVLLWVVMIAAEVAP